MVTSAIRHSRALVAVALAALLLAACAADEPDEPDEPEPDQIDVEEPEPDDEPAAVEEPDLAFVGPGGEEPTPADELTLTDDEIEAVRAGGYTAALVWHEDSAFIRAVQTGLTAQLDEIGIEVVSTSTAEFDAARQADNYDTALARDPDIIVTIVVDPTSAAEALRPAVEEGVRIVVLTTPPADYTAGDEIVGIATGEVTGYGRIAAEILGQELDGEGEVGWLFHDADFWFTNQRDQAFLDWTAYLHPDIEVVAEEGFTDPARTEDIVSALLTRHPDLSGLYVAWATAAEGALAALREAGREDVKIVTHDLDRSLALDMVEGGNVVGIVANPAVEMGRNLGILAAYGVLDKDAPQMAVVPPVGVTATNIVEGWQAEFAEDPPADLTP